MSMALAKTELHAAAGHELIQLVSFLVNHEEYGIEVLKIREIIRMPEITKVPSAPHYVEGIINLRGKVIPIISMRRRFGLDEVGHDSHTRIMVVDVAGGLTGFIVDAVSEVIRISNAEIQPPPAVIAGGMEHECITGVINHGEHLLIVLDIDRMFSDEEHAYIGGV